MADVINPEFMSVISHGPNGLHGVRLVPEKSTLLSAGRTRLKTREL